MNIHEAIDRIKSMNFSINDTQAIIDLMNELFSDTAIRSYDEGYEDGYAKARREYWH